MSFPQSGEKLSAGLLVYFRRHRKWFFWLMLPLVVGNWLAMIYLRYHYTVDVAAGFLVAALAVAVTEACFYFFYLPACKPIEP